MTNENEKKKIMKRSSYKYFDQLYEWVSQPRTQEEFLYKIHEIIDSCHGFRSIRNSDCALESIELLINNKKE